MSFLRFGDYPINIPINTPFGLNLRIEVPFADHPASGDTPWFKIQVCLAGREIANGLPVCFLYDTELVNLQCFENRGIQILRFFDYWAGMQHRYCESAWKTAADTNLTESGRSPFPNDFHAWGINIRAIAGAGVRDAWELLRNHSTAELAVGGQIIFTGLLAHIPQDEPMLGNLFMPMGLGVLGAYAAATALPEPVMPNYPGVESVQHNHIVSPIANPFSHMYTDEDDASPVSISENTNGVGDLASPPAPPAPPQTILDESAAPRQLEAKEG